MTVRELHSALLDLVLAHRDVQAGDATSDFLWHDILVDQISTLDNRIRAEGITP